MSIGWSDAYATGVREIDVQHQVLLEHVGRLEDALRFSPGTAGVELDALRDFAMGHFAAEERLMEHFAFPGAAVHREAHAGFLSAVARLRADYDLDGATEELCELVGGWLAQWLTHHIQELDQELGRYLVERAGPEASASGGTWVVASDSALRVLAVAPGRPLARGGVQVGDLILALGGRRVGELGVEGAVKALSSPGPGGLTVTVHPAGDRGRLETRFLPRRAAPRPTRG